MVNLSSIGGCCIIIKHHSLYYTAPVMVNSSSMKFVTIFGLCKSSTELITEMFGVNLTFGDADGEPLSFSSLPFSLPSDNLMRLLKCFKKEAGAYLDESTATKLDVMLAPAPKLLSRKNKKGKGVLLVDHQLLSRIRRSNQLQSR